MPGRPAAPNHCVLRSALSEVIFNPYIRVCPGRKDPGRPGLGPWPGREPGPFGWIVVLPVRVAYVSRVHDMGGQTGFGPVPVGEEGEPPFRADWEARVYALATMLRRRGMMGLRAWSRLL